MTIQTTEQYIPLNLVLFIMLYKVVVDEIVV